jgi:hypothetical protein
VICHECHESAQYVRRGDGRAAVEGCGSDGGCEKLFVQFAENA